MGTPTHVFSYETCDIFRNTYFVDYLQATAYVNIN